MADRTHLKSTAALAEELLHIKARKPAARDVEKNLIGLAISGGGIRSATFGLGVVESLRRFGVLERLDYLSTVSGGGYIGAWLSANCTRNPGWLRPDADWKASIAHLRRYSNYLSPSVGFFSADTWTIATIWFRNTVLIQTTVILAIACLLLVPRFLFALFKWWPTVEDLRWLTVVLFILGVVGIAGNQKRLTSNARFQLLESKHWLAGLVAAAVSAAAAFIWMKSTGFEPFVVGPQNVWHALVFALLLVLTGFCLLPVGVRATAWIFRTFLTSAAAPERINYTQRWVQGAVVLPMLASALLTTAIIWGQRGDPAFTSLETYGALVAGAWQHWPFPLSVVAASFWVLSFSGATNWRKPSGLFVATVAPAVAAFVLHALLCGVMLLFKNIHDDWVAFVWAPPLVALSFVLTIVVLIGMMGRESTNDVREWWSRLGAWLDIYAVAWLIVAVAAAYGPMLVRWLATLQPLTSMAAGGGWLGTVAAGLFAGKSETTNGATAAKGPVEKLKGLAAAVAPYMFVSALLVGVAFVLDVVIALNGGGSWAAVPEGSKPIAVTSMVFAGCAVALLIMAARVDINEFSLNAFYRHRLARCYLGASRGETQRKPQAFTNFDGDDDLPLDSLGAEGPLHLVNCALNLGGASDLALHTRHSASFTLSPLHCGSAYASIAPSGSPTEVGFRRTSVYGGRDGAPTLGQAISVSGAAASPNMGYHTSPVVAFLLTLFNVRLGWWFPHPNHPAAYASPHFSLRYMLAELFGGASDTSKFVMVSDGGHFENLGAYELVRRRCRLVIISDGECDPTPAFEGLGTLIRMCEVDLGARITINVEEIRPAAGRSGQRRWAIGEIDYGPTCPIKGTLVYLKASMTGREGTSVLQYRSSHPAFPHESTSDQFYREDQFESYGQLGREIAEELFAPHAKAADLEVFVSSLASQRS